MEERKIELTEKELVDKMAHATAIVFQNTTEKDIALMSLFIGHDICEAMQKLLFGTEDKKEE